MHAAIFRAVHCMLMSAFGVKCVYLCSDCSYHVSSGCGQSTAQGGVTPIDTVVTTATAGGQRSMVKVQIETAISQTPVAVS